MIGKWFPVYVYAVARSSRLVARFVTEYQRDLWIKIDPHDRHPIDGDHALVKSVKKWVLTGHDIEEGCVAPKEAAP